MSCSLNFPYNSDACSVRFGLPVAKVHGRNGNAPVAFVIHRLTKPLAEYAIEQTTPVPVTMLFYNTPRSVHWAFDSTGFGQNFVLETDIAWGLNGLVNNTPAVDALNLGAIPDARLIHLAFDSSDITPAAIASIANVICCLALKYGIAADAAHILPAVSFNENEDALEIVPDLLIQQAAQCVAQGGAQPPNYDTIPASLSIVLAQLQQCCADNKTRLDALEAWQPTVQPHIDAINAEITLLQGQVLALQNNQISPSTITSLQTLAGQLQTQIRGFADCLNKLCPNACPPTDCNDIYYQLQPNVNYPGVSRVVPPNTNTPLAFPVKIDDDNPPQVLNAQPWVAALECACTWRAEVSVMIKGRNWCAGSRAWLLMQTNAGIQQVAEWTSISGGWDAPTLYTTTPIPIPVPPSEAVSFYIATNEVNDVTEVQSGWVKLSCQK